MTAKFQKTITSVLSWIFVIVIFLDVLVDVFIDTPNIIYDFFWPYVLIKYLMIFIAYAMLFFGLYSYIYQRRTGSKFEWPILLVIFGLAFSVLYSAPAVSFLNVIKDDPLNFSMQIATFKGYLLNISLIFTVYLLLFLFYLKQLFSSPKVETT